MNYYVARDGQPQGPFTPQQLAQQGITPDTLVYNETMKDWTPAGNVPELQAYVLGGAQPVSDLPNGGFTPCNTPQPPYQQPYQQQQYQQPFQQPCPKTWLVESILVTLFCCLPFGIVGIVKAAGVSSAYNVGDYQRAIHASADAGKWTKIGFFCGIAGILLYVLFFVVLGIGAAGMM
ncbi:MAG: CD225/dispanin family protein [Muribaculaceae bacterium]|nr:CD225/dispanin family protein [Muribaculaceae bacterium]